MKNGFVYTEIICEIKFVRRKKVRECKHYADNSIRISACIFVLSNAHQLWDYCPNFR